MSFGTLYLVGVPIGNFDDITYRAIKTLESVDVIAAEDTRKAKKLLDHYRILGKDILSHGSHNEHSSVNGLVSLLQKGKNLAYISDAGMPGVSDPGYMLVRGCIQAGVTIQVIPGVTAAITAVSISGIPCDRFTFQGFIPRKSGERKRFLQSIAQAKETQIFYESPRRVVDMLTDVSEIFPNRLCFIGRELTKIHQEFIRGSVSDVLEQLKSRDEVLGEFAIVLEGHSGEVEVNENDLDEKIRSLLMQGVHAKDIRDNLSESTGLGKKDIYNRVLEVKKGL